MSLKASIKYFQTNKLFRDKLPDWLKQKGMRVEASPIHTNELISKLKEKLIEEAAEVADCKNENLVEELADVLEVVQAIAKAGNISLNDVEKVRLNKKEQRGGFDRGLYVRSIAIQEDHPEIQYFLSSPRKYPQINNSQDSCIFCQIANKQRKAEIIAEFTHCYVIKDQYPVSNGHLLIIPYIHTDNWFTASQEVHQDIILALQTMKKWLEVEYNPDGYNIGANCEEAAGQTVMHLHMHLIPRYKGDMPDPKGGVRGVIPDKQKY